MGVVSLPVPTSTLRCWFEIRPRLLAVLRQVAETLPAAQNANPADFIENRYIQTLEQRGVYGELERAFKQR